MVTNKTKKFICPKCGEKVEETKFTVISSCYCNRCKCWMVVKDEKK